MKRSARLALLFFSAAPLLLLGLVFRRFVREVVLLPAATAVWLLLRLFVLSIDQSVFWWGLIVLSAMTVFRLASRGPEAQRLPSHVAAARDRVSPWRYSILRNAEVADHDDMCRKEIIWLLAELYATRHLGAAKFQIRDAFAARRIPLPEPVFAFLFPPPPARKPPFLRHPVGALRAAVDASGKSLRRRMRARAGREADYAKSIEQVVSFIEREMRHEISGM